MANNRLSEGVGKKIVEALKKQSEIEINPISNQESAAENLNPFIQENLDDISIVEESADDVFAELEEDSALDELAQLDEPQTFAPQMEAPQFEEPVFAQQPQSQPFMNYQQQSASIPDNFASELDTFEIPSNIAVLKKLITQLPSGVTRHTGAQIIRQTMEALGISMKSVLQEAQQVQESLNNSAKECQSTIQEYKKQIITLEKQSQNFQKQYSALNELISLFIQTGR